MYILNIMKTTATVKQWGNSLAVRIPTAVAQDLGITTNSQVQLTSNGKTVTLKPQTKKKVNLEDLLNQITPANLHDEVNWGKPVGKEAW